MIQNEVSLESSRSEDFDQDIVTSAVKDTANSLNTTEEELLDQKAEKLEIKLIDEEFKKQYNF
jgi:hypothetical protein